jgi:hypothetical protein
MEPRRDGLEAMAQEHELGSQDDPLTRALAALGAALNGLDQRVAAFTAAATEGDAFEQDRARLAAELDAARARERALEAVAAEASAALGRAAAEVRAALTAEEA